jgi:hypothetical protein
MMAAQKYTREQLQKMMQDLEKNDTVEEVIFEYPDGRKVRHAGPRATKLLDSLFGPLSDEGAEGEEGDEGEEGEGEEGEEGDKPPAGTGSVWGRKK